MRSFFPVKGLGQNFLVDRDVLEKIADACGLVPGQEVLEIGPGQGALTALLLEKGARVTAVETDRRLLMPLTEQFAEKPFTLHHADILAFDLETLPPSLFPLTVVGNIPYNISSELVEKMVAARRQVRTLFLTVQLEFAQRLTAMPGTGEYSALTCLLNMFAETKILFKVFAGAFRPMPNVTSCFMRIDMRSAPLFPVRDEEAFIRLVRRAFQQRRKTILNALSSSGPKAGVERALDLAGLDKKLRPEVLSAGDYARIINNL